MSSAFSCPEPPLHRIDLRRYNVHHAGQNLRKMLVCFDLWGTHRVTFFRRYQTTHPWITFRADFTNNTPASLWLLLGEARSKCEHVVGVPLQPKVTADLLKMYLVKGVHGTAAIEGNTLTEDEIREHMAGELSVPPSREYQKQEIDNLLTAFNSIFESYLVDGPQPSITPALICDFNKTVLKDLKLDDGVVAGEVRKYSAGVASYRGAPAEDCEFLLKTLCEWMDELETGHKDLGVMGSAMIKAILAHLYLEWIHPFGDGNGRTGRLLEFYILMNAGVPVPSAHLLSDYYNQTRPEYYRQLAYASQSGGKIIPFLVYALTGFVEELRTQLQTIRHQQWGICWRDHVNEKFENLHSATNIRRRHLILDLAREKQGATKEKIKLLTPRVAQHYARKTDRTLTRDLNALLEGDFLTKEGEIYRAKFETILAFLPPRWWREESN